tara:strand:+ start:45 stop:515 length:471 start_codon:yes stop_codon:yes gene_type:complete
MDDKIKCVYKLKCRDTNITEFYIGSSINFIKRKSYHKGGSNNLNDKHYCNPLYMFINVNGGFDNWEFEIIKEYNLISKKELEINEQAYIELLKPELNDRNANGLDKERKKNTKKIMNNKWSKIHNNIKANCPHCGEEMLKKSIKRHISRKHEEKQN